MTLQNCLNLGKITQDLSTGKPAINSDANLYGQLTIFPKLEVKTNFNGSFFYPWTETTRYSGRIDLWSEDSTKEHEFSFFRDTFSTNSKVGIGIYKPDRTDTLNAYISANGNSFICANNGNMGVGTATPQEKLHVNGWIRSSTGLKLGVNLNLIQYASAAPTTGTWSRGDRIYNTAPSAGGFIGWVCVLGGSPGTWKTWGMISM